MEPCPSYLKLPEAKLLLTIINERPPFSFENTDLEKFIALVRLHNIAPLVFYRLQKYSQKIPPRIYSLLKSSYFLNLSINLKFWKDFLKIKEACQQNNIAFLPLKGMDILLRFYPAFDLRSMVDIDILVKEEQLPETEKVLSALGYQKNLLGLKEGYWRKQQCHIAFYKDRSLVEVHWGLDFKRANRSILPGVWERAQGRLAGGHKINIMSPEDALFSFALHLRRFGNILSLKQVLDVDKIIKATPDFDWDYVLRESQGGKMKAPVYFILMQVGLFTETIIPPGIFKELKLPGWQRMLIKKLILRKTFQISSSLKDNYLKAHFLLYDNLCESLLYLINIPYEQFCKFYDLKPYTRISNLLYGLRLIYMPLSLLLQLVSKVARIL